MKRGQRTYAFDDRSSDYLEDDLDPIYESITARKVAAAARKVAGPGGEVLRKKVSKGMKVRLLQKFLKIHVDGDFGNNTELAVIAWQKKNGFPPTGFVDRATWDEMVPFNDLRQVSDVMRSAGNPNDNEYMSGPEGALYVDEKNPAAHVVYIYVQGVWLNYAEYLADEAAKKAAGKVASEGHSGNKPESEEAEEDSESDDIRWEAKPGDGKIITTPMELGSKGLEVESLQEFLQIQGLIKGNPDGDYAAGTEKAVKAWQGRNGLPQTGKADKSTLEKMKIPSVKLLDQPMKSGDKGMPVHMLQRFLKKKGFWAKKPNGKWVKLTAKYDKDTKNGVILWQRSQGLPETGIVDKIELEKMQLRYANFDETYKGIVIKGSTYEKQKYDYDVSISLTKAVKEKYIPTVNKLYPNITRGFRALMVAMTHMEGFYEGSAAYTSNNPGNLNTTDVGSHAFSSLEAGIKAQYKHIYNVANNLEPNYPEGKKISQQPYYSPEMADNVHSYRKSPYVPGYEFTYSGQLDQFVKIYAVAARSGNNYINVVISYFKDVGLTVKPDYTIKQLIEMK